ncbi:UDP-N-acetylmuramate dehydrogenase [bacterium]|nr:UDP-N-acetylmuramate dehydrogenase [bacterium]
MEASRIAERLQREVKADVRLNVPFSRYTSYRIGGPAAVWVEPTSEDEVGRVLRVVAEEEVPLFLLGWGSNILVSDDGFEGVVLALRSNLAGWSFDRMDDEGDVNAGSMLIDLIRATVKRGLSGMEMLAGIPGSVGGALRMNAGAFGQEIEATTKEVKGFYLDGSPFALLREQIHFGYRKAPELDDTVITSATFQFVENDAEVLETRMEDILHLRAKKQPLEFPSCGSVFKRPPGYYAGALIEELGMKGYRSGGAMVSEKHAGFVVNVDNASADDVLSIIRRIEEKVEHRFGVKLEREVKLVGFNGEA